MVANRILEKSIQGIRAIPEFDMSLIGNPTFGELFQYEQDYVTPLLGYFGTHSLTENKVAIDSWVENIHALWGYGVSDVVFNFTLNNGVNTKGEVVLIDFGELTFNKTAVALRIAQKKWLTQWSYAHQVQDENLKTYIAQKLENELTIANLEKYWLSRGR